MDERQTCTREVNGGDSFLSLLLKNEWEAKDFTAGWRDCDAKFLLGRLLFLMEVHFKLDRMKLYLGVYGR